MSGSALRAQDVAADPLPHAEQQRLADGLYSRGLHALALEEYSRLLTLDPPPPSIDLIAFRAAECARALDDRNTALRLYLRVVALGREGETLQRARLRLAELTFELKKYTSTLAHTRALLDAAPPADFAVPALYLEGQALAALEKPDEAARAFQRLRRE
jgi:tetratricopeptide (TPR) repeat protein